ncbi:CHAT domain-containing protein [Humibacillus xanthopallidus]|uniref:CHAT domain-containing protein n=1 Tax=Humibacillus xanthopallidus TaxID=412689 RepID=A0A543HGJ9_9MICO|nr:CHAT domain-containing protein [Humibacillus xanthopallidus]TQM57471.1 CHAT domain-containing protein [Humibacillus xanthopallidus]
MEYDEFEVLLERSGDGYTARVVDSPTGPVPAMPFVPPEPVGGLPAVRLGVRGERRLKPGTPAPPSPKEFGADLFRALFNEKALAILRTSQYVAAKRQRGLRLRIRFADATALANLPWELLYDPERHWYPCQLSRFPTLRFVDLPEPVLPLQVTGPLRMLVVISSPVDLPPLEVEREWTLLRDELDPLVRSGRLELERLPVASLEDVRETLMHRDFHIFHYIGHGGSDEDTGEGHLAFTGPDGRQRRVSGSQLGVMLSNSPIRLAVLNSCEGGHVSDVDPYASTAIALVEQGIPAVVAMQFQITDTAATAFSRTLYDAVTAGRPVDLAVTLARQAVLAASEAEWATPVLYLRAVDGVLFDLAAPPEPAAAAAPGPHAGAAVPVSPVPVAVAAPPPGPAPPAQPRHVRAEVVDGVVNLMWQQPPVHGVPVRAWEVWRNGVRHAIVTLPMALDDTPGPGEYHYSVVALGDDEMRSGHSHTCTTYVTKPLRRASAPAATPPPRTAPVPVRQAPPPPVQHVRKKSRAGWILVVLLAVALVGWLLLRPGNEPIGADGRTGDSSQNVNPPPSDGPSVAETGTDLVLTRDPPGTGGGSGETTLRYSIYNAGPRSAENVSIDVRVKGEGTVITATLEPPGGAASKICAIVTDQHATCFAPAQEVHGTATLSILLYSQDPPPSLTVRVVSEASDSNPDDNVDTFQLPTP